MTFNNMGIMLPWFSNLIDEDRALLGDDWWPYGIQRNRSAIDVVLRYHHEQGLTKRRLTTEDVFPRFARYLSSQLRAFVVCFRKSPRSGDCVVSPGGLAGLTFIIAQQLPFFA